MSERVVLTGIGLVSCLGKNREETVCALKNGSSGIGIDPIRKEHGFRTSLTGVVKYDGPITPLPRRFRKSIPTHGLYAIEAIREAIVDAGLTEGEIRGRHDTGLITGNDTCLEAVLERYDHYLGQVDTKYLGAQATIRGMNSTLSLNLGPFLGIEGMTLTMSAACASGAHAIGVGRSFISQGLQKRMIVGGAQEVNWYAMAAFDAMRVISQREEDPQRASRPFEKDRDGLIPSGGAAFLIIESEEEAIGRGATIYGVIDGYGFSGDGEHPVVPNGKGALKAMEMALADAGIGPEKIDYINAHATSTIEGDRAEAWAINQLFGSNGTPLSSTKSMTGHECWMGGASEFAYSALMMRDRFMAPNINYESVDPNIPQLNIITKTVEADLACVMSNSFGFGGTNGVLILSKYEGASGNTTGPSSGTGNLS